MAQTKDHHCHIAGSILAEGEVWRQGPPLRPGPPRDRWVEAPDSVRAPPSVDERFELDEGCRNTNICNSLQALSVEITIHNTLQALLLFFPQPYHPPLRTFQDSYGDLTINPPAIMSQNLETKKQTLDCHPSGKVFF